MSIHLRVVAWIFIAGGIIGLIGAAGLSVAFGFAARAAGAAGDEDAALGRAILGLTGIALTIVLVALSIPSVACGWGLLRTRNWARLLGIVLAALALTAFPIGTIVGVYVIWVLFRIETETPGVP
jgi:hypothetical protein